MDVEFACSAQFPKEPAAPLVPHFPRFRALALFGRRPLQRGEGLVIAGGRKPTQYTKSLRDSPLRGGVTGRTVIVDRTSSLLRQRSDPSSTGRAAAREIGMLRQHCPRMTNPGAIGEAVHLDEQIANSFGSKESSSLKSSRVPAPMPPEGCPEPHHAEVVACDLFATPNSLKSRVARKVLSPFSNIHAVTPKLRTHSTSTAIQNQWTSNLRAALNFQKSRLRR